VINFKQPGVVLPKEHGSGADPQHYSDKKVKVLLLVWIFRNNVIKAKQFLLTNKITTGFVTQRSDAQCMIIKPIPVGRDHYRHFDLQRQ
jgi:hypothetical protein